MDKTGSSLLIRYTEIIYGKVSMVKHRIVNTLMNIIQKQVKRVV